ncbi:hypothetical protein [Frankia sp. Cas4]|uniref:hypothetical protein n=1 Tax=Frankia sp. Cas4 TaxID=3073927 RepID=UPI002AD1F43F|nr:hypothetical protein [Frankia sp. Cas4]
MTTGDQVVPDGGGWGDVEVWDKLAAWEKKSPATAKTLIEILQAERRHAHRLEWAHWARQMAGVILGFGCVIVMALLAWHYADIGSPINGALVMGAGTGSIVAIFVTGKYVGRAPSARERSRARGA